MGLSRGSLRDHHGAGRLRTQPRRFVFPGRRAAVREGMRMGGGPGKIGCNVS
jgi:hypothetical protein